ncbi:LuxR family transcriptional regulator [Nocardioides sp. AN3]
MTVEIRRTPLLVPAGRLRPTRASWHVPREELVRRVARSVDRVPLTLIRAPAGTGKTILAADWVSSRLQAGRPAAWLSLTDADDDPAVFWPRLRTALMVAGLLPEVTVPRPRAPAADVEALGTRLSQRGGPVVLVVDAVDRLRSRTLLGQIGTLLESGGDWLRVVMTSRTEPALPLQRFRVEDSLTEIGADDLAFGRDEIERVLLGHHVTPGDGICDDVLVRTEGWAAGVRLAALRLGAHDPAEESAHDQAQRRPDRQAADARAALDGFAELYLREQVVDPLAPAERDVLTAAAVVDELPPGLARALTGRADADALVRSLSTGNGFLLPVHGRLDTFRLHPLVAELLRADLDRQAPARSALLHRRAAEWFDDQGHLAAAVRHVTAAGDWQTAAERVVEGRGLAELILGTTTGVALAADLSAVPERGTPEASVLRAAIRLREGDLDGARAALDLVDGRPGVAVSVIWTAWCDAAGRTAETLVAVREARSRLEEADAPDPLVTAVVATAEGAAQLRAGDLAAASVALGEAVSATAGTDGPLRVRCLSELALAEACAGHLTRALELVDAAERAATEQGLAMTSRPVVLELARIWVAVERQDLHQAQRSLHRVSRTRIGRNDEVWRSATLLLRARYLRDRGDLPGARRQLGQAGPAPRWLRDHLEAESHGLEMGEHGRSERLAVGGYGRVQDLLDHADQRCRLGDLAAARSDIGRALKLGRVERLRRPFTHASSEVRSLIRHDARVHALAAWLGDDQLGADDAAVPRPVLEPLSERELEVLRHLAAFLTTEEIAAAMFISVNTVRTHIRRVLEKLSVSRRHEAVRRGQELGLV